MLHVDCKLLTLASAYAAVIDFTFRAFKSIKEILVHYAGPYPPRLGSEILPSGISIRKRTRGKRIAPIKGTTSSFWMSSILGELKRFTVAMKFNKKIMTNLEDNI